jgi:hypothetical protein
VSKNEIFNKSRRGSILEKRKQQSIYSERVAVRSFELDEWGGGNNHASRMHFNKFSLSYCFDQLNGKIRQAKKHLIKMTKSLKAPNIYIFPRNKNRPMEGRKKMEIKKRR